MVDIFTLVGRILVKNEQANAAIDLTKEKAKDLKDEFSNIGTESDTLSGKIGENSKLGTASVFFGNMLATMAVEAGRLATNLVKAGIGLASDMEQNMGGIETLFGDASATVFRNADNAYKTAGLSANKYMETITAFAAALKQSVETEEEAARIADMAIVDMSDNANKMGTDMASIQNAYQGFAKQNFTMLDNLKLGYGGTKEEMERLLADAGKLAGQEYDISSLADIFNAVHVIQEELGIAGTTAEEASTTLSGSASSAKSAWDNFLSTTMLDVIPKITELLNGVMKVVNENPEAVQKFGDVLSGFASISFDAILVLFEWLVDHSKEIGVALATVAAGLIAGAVATHPFAAAIMAVVGGLAMLKSRSDDLKSGEIFGKYSEEDLALLQKWVDAQKDVYNAKTEGAQNGIAAEDNASLQEAIALANQYHRELQKVDGLMHDYTDYSREQGGDMNKGIIIDVPTQVSEDSEGVMQEQLDGMTLESLAKIYPDLSEVYAAENQVLTFYANIVPANSPAGGRWINNLPGFATGLDRVPHDNFLARLHKDEAVLTSSEASAWRSGSTMTSGGTGKMEALLGQLITMTQQMVTNTGRSQQVVLDSGVLVGQIATQMDAQLGTIGSRKGRRN